MIRFDEGGWFLPDGEAHLQAWMLHVDQRRRERLTYQLYKYEMALKWVRPSRRVAVDVGAHVGLWSWVIAQDFRMVEAFEPMPRHRECWHANMEDSPNSRLHACALGDRVQTVSVVTRTPGSSGDTGVDPAAEQSSLRAAVDLDGAGGVRASMLKLDDFEFVDVDFIKVDTEGYELFVLRGAERTLRRCKPCVIVEQKPETGGAQRYGIGVTDAVTYLESLGAVRRGGIQGDYILSWP